MIQVVMKSGATSVDNAALPVAIADMLGAPGMPNLSSPPVSPASAQEAQENAVLVDGVKVSVISEFLYVLDAGGEQVAVFAPRTWSYAFPAPTLEDA